MTRGFWACVMAACFAATLAAQARPDFSGTWRMDTLRSRFDPKAKPPKSATLVIEQHEPKLRVQVSVEGGDDPENCTFDLTTDGTEVKTAAGGENYTASARWGDIDGTRLTLTISRETPQGTVVQDRQMKLGDQDRIMTTVLTTKDAKGEKKAYEFYSRQPAS